MVYIVIKDGREKTIYCAIVCAIKEESGVPKQKWYSQRMVLIRAHKPCNKKISCKDQTTVHLDIG